MALRYHPSGDLDNDSAVEDILSRYEDDVHKTQEISTCCHHLINLAAEMDDSGYGVEDAFSSGDEVHSCDPICEGGCAGLRWQARATCRVNIPGGASLVT